MFVTQRVERGDGPVKIRAALEERGVDADRISLVLEGRAGEWMERASAAARKRFGPDAPTSWNERAKRARFLQQRGFPADIVRRVTDFDGVDD